MRNYNLSKHSESLINKFITENICSDLKSRIEEKFSCNTVEVEVEVRLSGGFNNEFFIDAIVVVFIRDGVKHYDNYYMLDGQNDIEWSEMNINDVRNSMIEESDIIDAIALDYVYNGDYDNYKHKET